MSFANLPTEIKLLTLLNLNGHDLFAIMQTSKDLYSIAQESQIWNGHLLKWNIPLIFDDPKGQVQKTAALFRELVALSLSKLQVPLEIIGNPFEKKNQIVDYLKKNNHLTTALELGVTEKREEMFLILLESVESISFALFEKIVANFSSQTIEKSARKLSQPERDRGLIKATDTSNETLILFLLRDSQCIPSDCFIKICDQFSLNTIEQALLKIEIVPNSALISSIARTDIPNETIESMIKKTAMFQTNQQGSLKEFFIFVLSLGAFEESRTPLLSTFNIPMDSTMMIKFIEENYSTDFIKKVISNTVITAEILTTAISCQHKSFHHLLQASDLDIEELWRLRKIAQLYLMEDFTRAITTAIHTKQHAHGEQLSVKL